MTQTVASLAEIVAGEVRGAADRTISGATALETAGPSDVSFVQEEKHLSRLKNCRSGAMFITARLADSLPAEFPYSLIIVAEPQTAFQTILPLFRRVQARPPRGISPSAWISPSAKIGWDCSIGPGAYVGDDTVIGSGCDLYPGAYVGPHCQIGADVTLYPQVVLYHDVRVGDRVIIHAGAVIGADGFGYKFEGGRFHKIPQLGWVEIEADAEIGACTTIDRGAIGPTIVGEGTKIDNLVMIAHNCELGQHNIFASQVGLAGSCTTGDYVRLGGQVGIKDHVRLNSGCSIGAKGGVHKDIPAGETWIGYPATPEHEQKRLLFSLKRVPEMRQQVKDLEKQVAELTATVARLSAAASNTDSPLRAAG
ncbi:MAG: UDP-3-O-(3-hydroxymyristoyl)glucosamine N-acyltransferase [Planctomycetaceae bacterium]